MSQLAGVSDMPRYSNSGVGKDAVLNDFPLLSSGQPIGMTDVVKSAGKVVANFMSGKWTVTGGAPTITYQGGYDNATGLPNGMYSRTGQPEIMKYVPASNTGEEIRLAAANILTPMLAGKLGIWVYVENQPGYQPSGTLAGKIDITLTTNASASTGNGLYLSYNVNQVREGWNFLKFVQRNPAAYVTGSGVTEYHPLAVAVTSFGTGADTNIKDNQIYALRINVAGMLGATLYFDSMWTGWDVTPQICLGLDAAGNDFINYALPIFDAYSWLGYVAIPTRVWTGGSKIVSDFNIPQANAKIAYDKGWDMINHTTNHLPGTLLTPKMSELTSASEIAYEITGVAAQYVGNGLTRGNEFYASPQSSTSRLCEAVIKSLGIKLQRNSRKANTSITPWGLDNPHHIGSSDMGAMSSPAISYITGGAQGIVNGWQQASKINRMVDVTIDYQDAWFPFWHNITTLGDPGTGEGTTGDSLLMFKSNFDAVMAYIRSKELNGNLKVTKGLSGFYYGS